LGGSRALPAGLIAKSLKDTRRYCHRCQALAQRRLSYRQIETAQGFWNALAMARAGGVQRLLFGSIDFQLDLAWAPRKRKLLIFFRSQIVLISRLAEIQSPVDGVTTDIKFGGGGCVPTPCAPNGWLWGKMCIHPKQVPVVNECFAPTPEEEAWARRVVEASGRLMVGRLSVGWKDVDRPSARSAEKILGEHRTA